MSSYKISVQFYKHKKAIGVIDDISMLLTFIDKL